MIRFNNDYNRGAHPAILAALGEHNEESHAGYGLDEWCSKAADEIKKYLGAADVDVHFLVGGTQTNFTVISAALRPYESVLCADGGHINVHETGAVEHIGHKVEALKSVNGKITARQIKEAAEDYKNSTVPEHITEPKMVYISFPTEYGTIYTRRELEEISAVCREYGMYLFIDGARMGYGLAASEEVDYLSPVTLKDITELSDVFYIGGTKCGALMGEAVVIVNDELKKGFRSSMKQNGGMLAKGWLLGLQFYTLFKDGLYFDITRKAVLQAVSIRRAFNEAGIPTYIDSPTNQQFVLLNDEQLDKLSEKYIYEFEFRTDTAHTCVRFCTSWATADEDVEALIADIKEL